MRRVRKDLKLAVFQTFFIGWERPTGLPNETSSSSLVFIPFERVDSYGSGLPLLSIVHLSEYSRPLDLFQTT